MRQERSAHAAYGCRARQKHAAQKVTLSSRLPTMHSHPPTTAAAPLQTPTCMQASWHRAPHLEQYDSPCAAPLLPAPPLRLRPTGVLGTARPHVSQSCSER